MVELRVTASIQLIVLFCCFFFLPTFLEENYAKIFSNSGNIVAAKYVEGDETVMRLYFLSR